MATLEDLNYTSISNMTQDEAIDLLRQIRLSRRTPVKKAKGSTKKTSKKKDVKKTIDGMSVEEAAEMLKLLEGLEL